MQEKHNPVLFLVRGQHICSELTTCIEFMRATAVAAEDAILINPLKGYMHTSTHIACSVPSVREERERERSKDDIMGVGRSGNWDDLKGEGSKKGEDETCRNNNHFDGTILV